MPDHPATNFRMLRPAIKARWGALLHAAPAAPPGTTPLVTPEMMLFMLDDSLARLGAQLGKPPKGGQRGNDRLSYGPMRASCQCGLHLLLTYYLTGARALKEILPPDLGPARLRVLHDFNRMAHEEMTALCGLCRYRGGPRCSLRPGPAVNPPAAASRATPSATAPPRGGTRG